MNKNKASKIFPIILIVLIVVFTIFVLVSIGRAIFKDNGSSSSPSRYVPRNDLLTTSSDRSLRMVLRGPIVADENFRSYQIIISPKARMMTVYKGYLGEVLETLTLGNNETAYTEFVHALDKVGFGRSQALSGAADDTRGVCATGTMSEFDIKKDDQSLYHVWTSTCSGSKGSLGINESNLRNMFLKQVPDSAKVLNKHRL